MTITYTDYTFDVRGKVTVSLRGKGKGEESFMYAVEKAVKQVLKEIDETWIGDCLDTQTYNEEED